MAEYIEKEHLKEAFNADLQNLQSLDEHTMNMILMEIDEAPAADVAPVVRAKWIADMSTTLETTKCSACRRVFQAYYHNYQYCPRCGARMDDSCSAGEQE